MYITLNTDVINSKCVEQICIVGHTRIKHTSDIRQKYSYTPFTGSSSARDLFFFFKTSLTCKLHTYTYAQHMGNINIHQTLYSYTPFTGSSSARDVQYPALASFHKISHYTHRKHTNKKRHTVMLHTHYGI